MEPLQITTGMLDLMVRPAFCVKDGMIAGANQDAQRCMIQAGMSVDTLLPEDPAEYHSFRDGCLYLTVAVHGQPFGASVTKNGEYDIFVLEQEADHAELNAMALAAQELREPLANVMTVADRLFPVIGTDEVSQDQVSRINRGLFQILRVISNMSDASRYAQNTQPNYEIRDITSILEELFSKAGVLIRQAGIQFQFRNLPEAVYTLTDAEMLERAVYNLLSNAMKFTPQGGTIEASVIKRGQKIYLTVQDTGPGVEPGIRASIHNRYQRQPGLEDARFGIGLGMVLIRSAAAAHGGTVLMEHPAGMGARVTMTIQIRQNTTGSFRSHVLSVDYAGERDHGLMEFSESLPHQLYRKDQIN